MTENTWKERLQRLFGTQCPYEVLGVSKDVSEEGIRKGYYRKSLTCHPDRVIDESLKEEATEKFQALGAIYGAFCDAEKRAVYDETGVLFDEQENVSNWADYWRVFFKKITIQDIENFKKEFQGSEEELEQIKEAYLKCNGSMTKILDSVMTCNESDEPRFTEIIQNWIDEGSLPAYSAFTCESSSSKKTRKRKAQSEAKLAKKALKELGVGSSEDLSSLIAKRQMQREAASASFLDSLAAKYGGSPSKENDKKKKKK